MVYSTGIYRDAETGRRRWAVLGPTDVWYYPARYGKEAAKALCRRLNKEATDVK